MMDIFVLLTWVYRGILAYMAVFLVLNMTELEKLDEQVLTALVLIPVVFRLVGIK